jgi:L-threonylcarbamoyladenylate synthase
MSLNSEQLQAIQLATQLLQGGELVVIPTETVYGLAADAKNPQAIRKIFALKGRPANHPLIVHISDAQQLKHWAVHVPDIAYRLAEQFWPGPLTLILNKHSDVPDEVTGGQSTVGLRCPDNALSLALLRNFQGGVAAPSANRFGHISPTAAQHVHDEFGIQTPFILDAGPCDIGIESTIVDLSQSPARILRPGKIDLSQLLPFLPEIQQEAEQHSPRTSGDMAAHYAPRTPLQMLSREHLIAIAHLQKTVVLCFDDLPTGLSGITSPIHAEMYARQLYANLRKLDQQHAELIILEQIPQTTDWLAIADRIMRAVTGSGQNHS